jgi:hypothetical protein
LLWHSILESVTELKSCDLFKTEKRQILFPSKFSSNSYLWFQNFWILLLFTLFYISVFVVGVATKDQGKAGVGHERSQGHVAGNLLSWVLVQFMSGF